MCGIAGVVALGERPIDPAWGETLTRALSHRGPDGHGVFHEGRVLLAHRRLAIIDTGAGGAQPMHSGDGRHVLVQNGEIYNHAELRPDLERRGVPLRSRSDTEILLERVARDGPASFDALRGMWAFGLWDRERETLLLSRDRLGKKPIVHVRTADYFAFASEAAALLALPFVRARLDRVSLDAWLRLQYVPAPDTLLEDMKKLPPACWLEVKPGAPASEPVRYWRPPAADPGARPDTAWFDAFDRELLEATRLRTVSDVPIGVFLSGGIDSNLVLEALHRSGQPDIHTFTLGFAGLADERPLAALGAQRFSHQHTELVIEPDLARDIDTVLGHFADPIGDSAVITNGLIAREAAKHVKVILNGDGGDELCGGYGRFPFARRADLATPIPGGLALLDRRYRARANAGPAIAWLAAGQPARAARALAGVCSSAQVEALLGAGATPPRAYANPDWPGADGPGLTDAMFAWEGARYLPDDLMVKVDVASMAFGLENRSPLLDHRLFELVGRLPAARRADWRATKPLLRRYARGRIPDAIARGAKRGFPLPLAEWLRGPLRPWLDSMLADPQASAPVFQPGSVRAVLDAFHAGRGDDLAPLRLWALAVFEWWARRFAVDLAA